MTYDVQYTQEAQAFWDINGASLLKRESEYNLIIGLTLGVLSADRAWDALSFFTVLNGAEVVGQAMHTGGDKPLIITEMSEAAVEALVAAAHDFGFSPAGVSGPAKTAKFCAEKFSSATGGRVQLTQNQGVYELREVIWPKIDGGKLICAGMEHRTLVRAYVEAFIRECFPDEEAAGERADEMVNRLLGAGHIFLWETSGGELVAMAGRNREGETTATVSLVYTPPKHRGCGYARNVVASLSQLWLDRGKAACNLFTDLSNPTSNWVYESVGYVRLLESQVFEIQPS
jgi:uncharacterized protein